MKATQLLIVMVSLLFFQVTPANAQSLKVKTFKMSVNGTSSMHDWVSEVEKLECKTSYKVEGNVLVDIKETVVKIPVQSIKSTKGKMMDNKTYEAFNSEKYPFIVFTLASKKINASDLTAELRGSLAMAGTTKQIDLLVTYKVLPNGDLQINGSKQIKMTEYKMEPPTAMMGAIKVGDEVVINFEILLTNSVTNF
jgi:polyisoprenoid-binding protein YceI